MSQRHQQQRLAKFKKRQERDERERAKGKAPPLTPEQRRRMEAHEAAFLVPIPLYFGYYGYGYPSCAAFAGNVVYGVNGNGIGSCAALAPVEAQHVEVVDAEVVDAEVVDAEVVEVLVVDAEEDAEEADHVFYILPYTHAVNGVFNSTMPDLAAYPKLYAALLVCATDLGDIIFL
ncbi:hypothetical protein H0H92_001159 [Tricholoma furcatifolium]|nr:hypothetical protein H0H92_001159 [Tricholoma furcatifolium]